MTTKIFPCSVLFFILFMLISFYSEAAGETQELKDIAERIKKEEALLKKLRAEKAAAVKQLALIDSRISDYKRMISLVNKDIAAISASLSETGASISSARRNIAKMKKNISESSIFVIDNLGYSNLKIISTAQNPENTIKTLEILSKVQIRVGAKIAEFHSAIKELSDLYEKQKRDISVLNEKKAEQSAASKSLRSEQADYLRTLALLKNDEAGRIEYLEMLDFQRKELNNKINEREKTVIYAPSPDSVSIGNSAFAKLKGTLPWPLKGTVIEGYGEHLVKEAGVSFLHKGWKIRPQDTSPVSSSASGVVIFADYMKGFDNIVIVSHGASFYTVYGNLAGTNVKAGQKVRQGEILGRIDVDRNNNTSYLYFEIRKKDTALDPSAWLASGLRR